MPLAIFAVLSICSLFVPVWSALIVVDDRDPSITYQPDIAWLTAGNPDEIDQTTHYTYTPFANFTFSFTGTAIQVIGTQDLRSPGGFTYQLDDGPEHRGLAYDGRTSGIVFAEFLNLANTKHTLVFKNGGPNETMLIFDAIRYTDESVAVTTTSAAGALTTTTTHRTDSLAATNTSLTSTGDSRNSLNVGALAGGLVGGLFCLALLVFAAILFYRHRRALNQGAPWQAPPTYRASMLEPEPYPMPNPPPADLSRSSLIAFSGNRKEHLPPSANLPSHTYGPSLPSFHGSRTDVLPPPLPVDRSSERRLRVDI